MSQTTMPQTDWDRAEYPGTGLPLLAGRVKPSAPPVQPEFMARRRSDLLLRTINEEIVPRLVLSRHGDSSLKADQPIDTGDHVAELVSLVLKTRFDVDSPEIDRISGRRGAESIYLDLLAPTALRLGDMWTEDLCDFVQVTIGLVRLQQILTTLSVPLASDCGGQSRKPRILLAPGPGDQHSFGLSMVSSFFQRAGWSGWSGVPASQDDLLARLRAEAFAVVGFSVSNETRLDALTRVIRSIRRVSRNREIGVMVGGPVFLAHPELVAMVGADTTAADGRDAVLQAQRLLTLIPTRG